jgi:hypothetical protein
VSTPTSLWIAVPRVAARPRSVATTVCGPLLAEAFAPCQPVADDPGLETAGLVRYGYVPRQVTSAAVTADSDAPPASNKIGPPNLPA